MFITWALFSFSFSTQGQTQTPTKSSTGLYDSYVQLLEIGKENYKKKLIKLKQNSSNLLDLKDINSIDIDPDFLSHVLTYSPARYAYLGLKDQCSFYDLLLAGVLKDHEGVIDYVIVRYITKEDKKRRSWVKLDAFINAVALQKCPKVKSFQTYFTLDNFSKTVKAIKLVPPSTIDDCKNVHKDFIADHKTPYLCSIYDQIDDINRLQNQLSNTSKSNIRTYSILKNKLEQAQQYKSKINQKGLSYLENLCENIEDEKTFCDNFFNKSFWSRVVDGEKPLENLTTICQEVLGRKSLVLANYKTCARQISKDPELCRWNGSHFPSLLPKPSCNEIEQNLNYSRLNTDYLDCPGQVGNSAMVNIARILRHFRPEESKSYSFCSLATASTFLDFNQESVDARTWDMQLCYEDKLNEKEVCLPTLTGDVEGSPFSLSTVVSQILSSTRGTDPDMKCKVISSSRYNPNLLEYKNGCFITYDPNNCSAVECQHKIIYNEQEVKHIVQKQNVHIDYFPNNFKYEKFSQSSLMKEYLRMKDKKIINITILKNFFSTYPKGIIHAIGCLEDIYPEIQPQNTFNQCSPTPFIVDGYIEKDGYYSLITRTALDDLHAPRAVPWNNIFQAVKKYQGFHPLKFWSLYGIYIAK